MVISGLSGNEIFCLDKVGYRPGDLVVGNSVFSIGVWGNIKAHMQEIFGGEIHDYTSVISEGRRLSYQRLEKEMAQIKAEGCTGVTSQLIFHPGNVEFLATASALQSHDAGQGPFTSSADGQELYCQIDADYQPRKFVFGNVAYSIGVASNMIGNLKTLARGEVSEYTEIFSKTRHLALERIINDAKSASANSVLGIRTTILPFHSVGVQEMLMIGTASWNPQLSGVGDEVITSDLTCIETWNLAKIGFVPLRMIMGTSVYSLGVIGNMKSSLENLVRGEVDDLTSLIYDARKKALDKMHKEASEIGADGVVGVETYIYALPGGLIEYLAMGTAVKYMGDRVSTKSEQLLPQAMIPDKDTFYDSADKGYGINLGEKQDITSENIAKFFEQQEKQNKANSNSQETQTKS